VYEKRRAKEVILVSKGKVERVASLIVESIGPAEIMSIADFLDEASDQDISELRGILTDKAVGKIRDRIGLEELLSLMTHNELIELIMGIDDIQEILDRVKLGDTVYYCDEANGER
jgi:hypothetical protein